LEALILLAMIGALADADFGTTAFGIMPELLDMCMATADLGTGIDEVAHGTFRAEGDTVCC